MPEPHNVLPQWTLEDAYGSVSDPRYHAEMQNAQEALQTLKRYIDCLLYTSPSPRD